ncbi:hypothetical protein Z948_3286 [Sulfitobacter donghicola DSW-25 = KCTC 12864 = JCM 14565]|nr:hypothetical protein Z948_3286 [Sulfitobacter donghicola DSW-25 = KCTC 12864 = JCM 14565]
MRTETALGLDAAASGRVFCFVSVIGQASAPFMKVQNHS